MFETTLHMWLVYGIIVAGIVSYAMERLTLELTSILVIGALLLLFQIYPLVDAEGTRLLTESMLLSGFADPALIAILALLVVGQALVQTGALARPTGVIVRLGARHGTLVVFSILVLCVVISGFLNNTPVVVMFIPIMVAVSERLGRSASGIMMPLSFVAILGGMTTLIGSSTNLLAGAAYHSVVADSIGFFDFTVIGSVMAGVGLVYVLFILPRLLPDRSSMKRELTGGDDGKQFIAQIDINPGNPLIGAQPVAGLFKQLPNMTVRLIQRGEHAILPPFDDEATIRAGDSIVVASTRKALTDLIARNPAVLEGAFEVAAEELGETEEALPTGAGRSLVEVMVAPASRLDGRTLAMTGFHAQTNCLVLGIQRRSRMIRAAIDDIRLEAGDVLLVAGRTADIERLRLNKDVLIMEWSTTELPRTAHANRALLIFLGVVAASATELLPISVAALLGAAGVVAGRCLNVRQAIRAIDRRVVFLVAAALAMGAALQATGGASAVAHGLVTLLQGAPAAVVLSAFFVLVAISTNILSNNATAVLFTPIAMSMAVSLNVDPKIFVICVILAANCSFATPIAYQTNLLVMGPGHYTFNDFVKGGTPLIFLIWLAFTLFAPWYYGLGW